jgi:hypothetical protein
MRRMQGEQSLWRENAYGDIWQEPQLFDQGDAVQTELDPTTDDEEEKWRTR